MFTGFNNESQFGDARIKISLTRITETQTAEVRPGIAFRFECSTLVKGYDQNDYTPHKMIIFSIFLKFKVHVKCNVSTE